MRSCGQEDFVGGDDLITARQLANKLHVDVTWVYRNSDKLPGVRVGKLYRFRASQIDAWLERGGSNG